MPTISQSGQPSRIPRASVLPTNPQIPVIRMRMGKVRVRQEVEDGGVAPPPPPPPPPGGGEALPRAPRFHARPAQPPPVFFFPPSLLKTQPPTWSADSAHISLS